jgi:hypothetical protein
VLRTTRAAEMSHIRSGDIIVMHDSRSSPGCGSSPYSRDHHPVAAGESLPGDAPDSEEQAERDGLPDIVIHDGAEWVSPDRKQGAGSTDR